MNSLEGENVTARAWLDGKHVSMQMIHSRSDGGWVVAMWGMTDKYKSEAPTRIAAKSTNRSQQLRVLSCWLDGVG